jgi:hypothetical protein
LIGVLMDEPAMPQLDAGAWPKPRTPAERDADDRR